MEAEREFRQFSDQLRLQTANNFSNLSLGDSIWSDPLLSSTKNLGVNGRNNDDWKLGFASGSGQKLAFANNTKLDRYNSNDNNSSSVVGAKSGSYFNGFNSNNNYNNAEVKNYFDRSIGKTASLNGEKKKNSNNSVFGKGNKKNNSNNRDNSNGNGATGAALDKRFKTLPPEESLPRNEAIGGYIFVCNNDTMEENLRRQLFGLPQRYRDSVRAITPGLPLFLYNYSNHQLHGVFEAASFGGTNIDPTAWEDKKKPGESRFPAQVKVITRKNCEPLEEDAFRPILHHYDGPKFRLELSVPEVLDVLDKFAEQNP